jgi:Na+-transporting NADH:ubiquinone oxidoreductase subunit NqrF
MLYTEEIEFECGMTGPDLSYAKLRRRSFTYYVIYTHLVLILLPLSGDLHFDVRDIACDCVNDLVPESMFSAGVEELKDTVCKVEVLWKTSQIRVSVFSTGKAQCSEIKIRVKFEGADLENISKDTITSGEHSEGRHLYQGQLLSGSSLQLMCSWCRAVLFKRRSND